MAEEMSSAGECPIDVGASGVTAVVTALLIFAALSCLFAALRRHSLHLPTASKRHFTPASTRDKRPRTILVSTRSTAEVSSRLSPPATATDERSGGRKIVRFAEKTSVESVQAFYNTQDFYQDPPLYT